MNRLGYNHKLLKETREKQNITIFRIALAMCLNENHIISMEQNSTEYFPSLTLQLASVKRYAKILGLKPIEIFNDADAVDEELLSPKQRL